MCQPVLKKKQTKIRFKKADPSVTYSHEFKNIGGRASQSESSMTCDKFMEEVVVNISRDAKSFEFLPVAGVLDPSSANLSTDEQLFDVVMVVLVQQRFLLAHKRIS